MNSLQGWRRGYLIRYLLDENAQYAGTEIPDGEAEQRRLLRGLLNVREPAPASKEFLAVQDEYLKEELRLKGITDYHDAERLGEHIYLWKGDITTLRCDVIVNAANSSLLGCRKANHLCIDNCIHTYSGVQLRLECAELIRRQGHPEPTGTAKITGAYNLPCRYVLHTVGPIVDGPLNREHKTLLADCYKSCLRTADEYELGSIAFCCISTGVFGFPKQDAMCVAVDTVKQYFRRSKRNMDVIFNVFSDEDYFAYWNML